jgi:sugar phosphate permease
MCLFCSKLVAYSMLFWLPHYLSQNGYTDAEASDISSFFDVGGIAGGVCVGYLKDRTGKPATTITGFLLASIPILLVFRQVTAANGSLGACSALMIAMGLSVDGPMHMIAGAICADLGSETLAMLRAEEAEERKRLGLPPQSIDEDAANFTAGHGGQKMRTREAESIALVTGILDGLASIGGATQGVAVGLALDYGGWDAVFWLFIGTSFAASLFISRLLLKECGCRRDSRSLITDSQ